MSDTKLEGKLQERSLAKGLLAGLIGGVVATAAKSLSEKVYPPRIPGEPEPPAVLADKLAGHLLPGRTAATETIPWAFGAIAGGAYGVLAEYYPAATAKDGASFGLALAALTHGTAVPAKELSAKPEEQTTRERTSEMSTHVIFGLVTETVRKNIRKFL